MDIGIDNAIEAWKSDTGYRKINSYLIKSTSVNDYKYHQLDRDFIESRTHKGLQRYKTQDVVYTIKNHMHESEKPEIYYRGDSDNRLKKTRQIGSFISVTTDIETADAFKDGECCIYKIYVNPSVKRISTGIEYELILENDLFWNYTGKEENTENHTMYKVDVSKEPNPLVSHMLPEKAISPIKASKKTSNFEDLSDDKQKELFDEFNSEATSEDPMIEYTPTGFMEYITMLGIDISEAYANKIIEDNKKGGGKINKKIKYLPIHLFKMRYKSKRKTKHKRKSKHKSKSKHKRKSKHKSKKAFNQNKYNQ